MAQTTPPAGTEGTYLVHLDRKAHESYLVQAANPKEAQARARESEGRLLDKQTYDVEIVDTLAVTPQNRVAQCHICTRVWLENDLNEPEHLSERVDAGEEMPAGECPECGALCSLVDLGRTP